MRAIKSVVIVISLSIVLLSISVSSCGAVNGVPFGYDTHAIEKLQKNVPFPIVVPAYFPEGIVPYPSGISGPSKGSRSDDSIEFGLVYEGEDEGKFIWINEENFDQVVFKPTEPTSLYLEISGINVLREEIEDTVLSKSHDEFILIHGFYYAWVNDGISFMVEIFGYDEDVCRKVIESMIRKTE